MCDNPIRTHTACAILSLAISRFQLLCLMCMCKRIIRAVRVCRVQPLAHPLLTLLWYTNCRLAAGLQPGTDTKLCMTVSDHVYFCRLPCPAWTQLAEQCRWPLGHGNNTLPCSCQSLACIFADELCRAYVHMTFICPAWCGGYVQAGGPNVYAIPSSAVGRRCFYV
jgi:hypothetical protein